jgi:hypothetical protein
MGALDKQLAMTGAISLMLHSEANGAAGGADRLGAVLGVVHDARTLNNRADRNN